MKLTHCKLKKSTQKKLLEFFIAEVTARTAADLLEIQPNTAALFYHKIRQVISYHLALEAHEIFEGKIEARAILVVIEREKEGVEPQERWRFLGC